MINREEFLQALVSFLEFSRTAPDREAGKALHELEALSPNSDLSNIFFMVPRSALQKKLSMKPYSEKRYGKKVVGRQLERALSN